jgi:hypothetical protein
MKQKMSLLVELKRNDVPIQKRDGKKRWSTLERELHALASPVPIKPRRRATVVAVSPETDVNPETDADDSFYDKSYSSESVPDVTLGSSFVACGNTEMATADESIFPGDSGNVILNFDDLNLTVQSLACGKCGEGDLMSHKKTIVFATLFSITCSRCDHTVGTLPKKRLPSPGYKATAGKGSFLDYQINIRCLMICQELGKGESGYKGIHSGLDIQSPTLVNYSKMEQSVSTQLMVLSKDIIRENVEAEVRATRTDPKYSGNGLDGRCSLTVGVDAGWMQRSSGKAYNSDTGQISMIGKSIIPITTP